MIFLYLIKIYELFSIFNFCMKSMIAYYFTSFKNMVLAPFYFHVSQAALATDYVNMFFDIGENLIFFLVVFLFLAAYLFLKDVIFFVLSFFTFKKYPSNFLSLFLLNNFKKFWSFFKKFF